MQLLEYEAKALLKTAGLRIPNGSVVNDTSSTLKTPVVLKSQVPTGGRGKLGGVVVVESPPEIAPTISRLLALTIKGFTPKVLLAEEKINIAKEFYISLLVDRDTASIRLIGHASGGIEVESNDTNEFFNQPVNSNTINDQARALGTYLRLNDDLFVPIAIRLFNTFVTNDMLLLEVNPLILTTTSDLVCGDCKIELDDTAVFRHPEWQFEDSPQNVNFVTLDSDGTVATIANGAGLAMATVDAVVAKNMKPANFLDIGGGANADSILAAFQKIVEYPNVQSIVVNIFAGITRCDEVAHAIITAKKQIPHLPPLFIRLAGTHFEEAVQLLSDQDIPTLASLDECLDAAKEVVYA